MKKTTLIALAFLFSSQTAFTAEAPERNYVEGDGTLNFTCEDSNSKTSPNNKFHFTLMYDENSENQGFDLISDDNLATGNGDIVYKIEVSQQPLEDSKTLPEKQLLAGCTQAPLTIKQNEENEHLIEIAFQCDGDGDAGHGQITLNTEAEDINIQGDISFPEGQSDLHYPIHEDTQMSLNCTF